MDATYVTGTTIFIDGGLMRRAGSLWACRLWPIEHVLDPDKGRGRAL